MLSDFVNEAGYDPFRPDKKSHRLSGRLSNQFPPNKAFAAMQEEEPSMSLAALFLSFLSIFNIHHGASTTVKPALPAVVANAQHASTVAGFPCTVCNHY